MNTDTGQILRLNLDQLERRQIAGEPLVEINEALMTDKQRENMAVSLNDTRSALGKQLHEARSKYKPHVGKKELAKLAARSA